jgi:hypothetical protein
LRSFLPPPAQHPRTKLSREFFTDPDHLPRLLPAHRIDELRNWGFHDAADALAAFQPLVKALMDREESIRRALEAIHGGAVPQHHE